MSEQLDPPFDRPDRGFNQLPGWSWIGTYGGYYLQCDALQAFEHGFFTRQWQGRGPHDLVGYVRAGVSVHRTKQVHGGTVLEASATSQEPWPDADGLVSDAGGQSLWVCGADCTPVLLADPVTGHVAACHAGWRGVAAQVLGHAVAALEQRGAQRSSLLVALGPAVSGPNYQVERRVSEQLGSISELQAAGALLEDPDPQRDRLDIRQAARLQLLQLGLTPEHLHLCPLCTVAEPLLFHSWRRDQVKAVQWSAIVSQAA